MVGAPVRRQQVGFAQKHGVSQRRACALFSTSRSTLRYTSRLEARDGPLLVALKQLSDQFPRFGYRRILVFMEQLGHAMGADKALRLWQKAGLQVPRKRPRKRVAHSRPRPQLPSGVKDNFRWVRSFRTVEELRLALLAFKETYNQRRKIGRHGYKSPIQVRQRQKIEVAKVA